MIQGNFSFPTSVVVGAGCVKTLGAAMERLGVHRPLLVTDPGLLVTAAFATVKDAAGGSSVVFSGVHANPIEEDVEGAAAAFRDQGCDSVIGVGGGSALDVAKILRARVARPDVRLADFYSVPDWTGLAPFVAIPTTAGTGSEVGRSSVIGVEGRKRVYFHPSLLAAQVFLDPELSVSLPPGLTAATGLDALTHCIESFTSPVFHPLCDGIALEGARIVDEFLPRAVANGGDLEARTQMLVAAAMGGVAFQKDLGAVHSMAHPLSTLFGMHHGLANALCLVAVMEYNVSKKPGLYLRLGQALGLRENSDATVIQRIKELFSQCGIQGGLAGHGVTGESIPALAEAATEDTCHRTNPVPVSTEDFAKLYQRCL
jgi:alcohol dehydrogenase class IV